jgi:putative transposase
MARWARVVVPTVPHHVTQRGTRRLPVFLCEDDYRTYLRLLRDWCDREGVSIWAYCLMSNHVHLIAVPETESGLARAIGEAHRRYTRAVNFRQGWRGYLFQGRFASCPMDERYLLAAVRYVELNPVRAQMAQTAWEYPWSSAAAHTQGKDDRLVKVQPMLERVADWHEYLDRESDAAELKALRRHNRTGRPLGDNEFIARLEQATGRDLRPHKPGPHGSRKHKQDGSD